MFSTGWQYLLSTIWTNKEGEPNAGHVTSVAPGDWSSSVLCDLGKQVGIFLKLFIKNVLKMLEADLSSEAELTVSCNL